VPGNRMKMGREHRAPLSPPAVALLSALPRMAGTDLVFPAPRGGSLSDMTLSAVVRRMKVAAVPHGFRSTFRDWASERTNYPVMSPKWPWLTPLVTGWRLPIGAAIYLRNGDA